MCVTERKKYKKEKKITMNIFIRKEAKEEDHLTVNKRLEIPSLKSTTKTTTLKHTYIILTNDH